MAEKRGYHSLSVKLMAALVVSALISVLLFFVFRSVGYLLVDKIYMAPQRLEARVNEDIGSFRAYVSANKVLSSDAVSIGAWNREHPYVRLTVSGRETLISSDSRGADLLLTRSALTMWTGTGPVYQFPVNFADGACTVSVYNFSEVNLITTVTVVSVVLSALVFLLCMGFYEHRVTQTIRKLSRQVRKVSQGDLQMQIVPQTDDEIGWLASDVDAMRLSIIQQLQEEEKAWQANRDLITAISHDVRTPLTALMGYLEILSDETLDPASRKAYLDVCRSNSRRLKDLTDELFRFFLVFGRETPEVQLEQFDAPTLLEQILFEARLELSRQGFDVQISYDPEFSGTLSLDMGHFRRVLENLFSNLCKYADRTRPVSMTVQVQPENLIFSVENFVPETAEPAESNRIGLKTCQKLLCAMGGGFRQERTGDRFTAEITLPLETQSQGDGTAEV